MFVRPASGCGTSTPTPASGRRHTAGCAAETTAANDLLTALAWTARHESPDQAMATPPIEHGRMTPPPSEDPAVSRVLDERPEQRFVGDRDLTAWPTAAGFGLVRLAGRLRQRLTPHAVLLVVLAVGLVLAAGLTALAGAVYDAVTEDDGITALDRPFLDTVIGLRTPVGNTLVAAYSSLGGAVGMPLLATAVAVGLAVTWRQWTPVLLIAATAAGSLALTVVGKAVVGRVRPPLPDAVPPTSSAPRSPAATPSTRSRSPASSPTCSCAASTASGPGPPPSSPPPCSPCSWARAACTWATTGSPRPRRLRPRPRLAHHSHHRTPAAAHPPNGSTPRRVARCLM